MGKNYSFYSICLNTISILIGIICVILSILEERFVIASITLLVMTIIELIINLINYRKLRLK
jgi:hypothetical protein